jgi:hypothetical protein
LFTKKGLIECFDTNAFPWGDEEAVNKVKKSWDIKVNNDDLVVMLSKKGSSIMNEEPLFYTRVEIKLNGGEPCSGSKAEHERLRMMKAVHSLSDRTTWDGTVQTAETINTDKKALINHVVSKSPFSAIISARDTIDKKFKFVHDNAYYIYTSCVPNKVLP